MAMAAVINLCISVWLEIEGLNIHFRLATYFPTWEYIFLLSMILNVTWNSFRSLWISDHLSELLHRSVCGFSFENGPDQKKRKENGPDQPFLRL